MNEYCTECVSYKITF